MAVQAQFISTVSLTDNLTGSIQLQKQINLSYSGIVSEFAQSQTIGTSPVTIVMPGVPVEFLYLKNLSTSATITVNWASVEVGSSTQILVLQPGSFILFLESNAVSGITAMTLTASASGTTVEYILVS